MKPTQAEGKNGMKWELPWAGRAGGEEVFIVQRRQISASQQKSFKTDSHYTGDRDVLAY